MVVSGNIAFELKNFFMLIGIDASRYGHEQATGVEWYSRHIIDGILEIVSKDDSDKVVLYSRDRLDLGKKYKNVKKAH